MLRHLSIARLFGRAARDDAWTPTAPIPTQKVAFSPDEHTRLRTGETVLRHTSSGGTHTGTAAVLVSATNRTIFEHLLNFDAYVEFLPYITSSQGRTHAHGKQCDVYDASFKVTTKGVVTEYSVRHWHYPSNGWLVFQMKAGGLTSLVRSAKGSWHVSRWGQDWSKALLTYEITLETSRMVPDFLKRMAAEQVLPVAATAIARRSEGADS